MRIMTRRSIVCSYRSCPAIPRSSIVAIDCLPAENERVNRGSTYVRACAPAARDRAVSLSGKCRGMNLSFIIAQATATDPASVTPTFSADQVLAPYVYVFYMAFGIAFVFTPIMRSVAMYYGIIDEP